ncbi:MAP7 (E-MAP-115) family [Nesidiocoris tenuis]|uniref:MAP7 (E-MAP-115) family n=2 Tax=Nesidiocoris tenuis TaxID=355587 RepID=A0ABN7AL75_9HEMI|nr:MAP7 (E-MAP-115) family [Nesidiocoris tenuis]
MFSELCRETLRRAVASGYLGYIISLRDELAAADASEDESEEEEDDQLVTYFRSPSSCSSISSTSSYHYAGATPVDNTQNGRPSTAKQDQGSLHWFGECASQPDPRPRRKRRHNNGTSQATSSTGLWFTDDPSIEGKDGALQVDRDERLRLLKEKQNEERQRKLEELKQQALAAQKFREQKEEERRRRLDEMRLRDSDRRHQVEERKRQIWEAERDRREAILRKNQEREARIETKRKNERSQIVFAFGSSTPRMLEPSDAGTSYWASRRATSTTNVMTLSMSAAAPGPLTRRSSERELDSNKKRATSTPGFERKPHHDDATDAAPPGVVGYGSAWRKDAARRKTDLIPTILSSPRSESSTVPPSGARTPSRKSAPGRAYSMSRLDVLSAPRRPRLPPAEAPSPQLGSGGSRSRSRVDVYRSMSVLPGPAAAEKSGQSEEGRPAKGLIKGAKSMLHLGPVPPPRATRAERLRRKAREMAAQGKSPDPSPAGARSGEMTPSRPVSSMSQHSVASNLSSASASLRTRSATAPRRPRPFSIAVTGVTTDKQQQQSVDKHVKSPNVSGADKPPIPKVHAAPKKPSTAPKPESLMKKPEKPKSAKTSGASTPKTTPLQSPIVETGEPDEVVQNTATNSENTTATSSMSSTIIEETKFEAIPAESNELIQIFTTTSTVSTTAVEEVKTELPQEPSPPAEATPAPPQLPTSEASPPPAENTNAPVRAAPTTNATVPPPAEAPQPNSGLDVEFADADMTASMIARVRIQTEEEAKAALAERRRLAREQAEREAELERQRLEAERLAEEERIRKEEEEQRRMEEEQLRLLEEARKAEELRLQQAIEEARKREEEERKQKEEDLRLKIEKEEAERKAKEESEKLRIEMEIRLKKEEEDRQARRKRVEAIMLRTRGKGSLTSNTTPTKDGEEEDALSAEENKKTEDDPTDTHKFLHSERSHTDANSHNVNDGSHSDVQTVQENNNRHNGHHNGSYNNSVTQNNVTNALLVNLGDETVTDIHLVNEILESNSGKLNAEAPQFIPQFQEKKDAHTVNDLLS